MPLTYLNTTAVFSKINENRLLKLLKKNATFSLLIFAKAEGVKLNF